MIIVFNPVSKKYIDIPHKQLIRMSWMEAIIEMCEKTGLLDKTIINKAKKFKG